MAIEIVSFPIKNGGSFNSYVSLPEGTPNGERGSAVLHLFGQFRSSIHGLMQVGKSSGPMDQVPWDFSSQESSRIIIVWITLW